MSRTVDSLKGKDNGAGSGTMTGEEREKNAGESVIVGHEKERMLARFSERLIGIELIAFGQAQLLAEKGKELFFMVLQHTHISGYTR